MKQYKAVGIMSGSSMDGVDLVYAHLTEENNKWGYSILASETVPYEEKWRVRLSQLGKQNALIYVKTHTFYGHYLGQLVLSFIQKNNLEVDFIASHGHTIFHQPNEGYTAQVGDGAAIHAVSGYPVISDFRLTDVALLGQGAPLVPIGDTLLFGDYDYCLNLGGFTNLSAQTPSGVVAFDVCPCNIALNRVARNMGMDYDKDGAAAATGSINYDLLKQLDNLSYYDTFEPKSLGREWINAEFWPIVRKFDVNGVAQKDLMKTLVDHISGAIADAVEHYTESEIENKKVLVTGGGAFNTTLLEHIRSQCDAQFIVPEESQLIEYKEALIFGLLGVLRLRQENNVLASVTGAKRDNIGGAMWGDFSKII